MAIIGTMEKMKDGTFQGQIKTILIDCCISLHLNEEKGENDSRPDYRIRVDGYEAGAGWKKVSKKDTDYVSIQIDDPALSAPINANLTHKDDKYTLFWERRD